MELEVVSALAVRVTPPSVVVDAGDAAQFTCVISGEWPYYLYYSMPVTRISHFFPRIFSG